MLSYRKLAMRVLGRPLHTEGISSPHPASQRAAAFILTAIMLTSLTAPAFAKTWCIEDGNITVKAGDTGNDVTQKGETTYGDTDTIITNQNKDIASSNTVTIETNDKNDKVEVTLKDVNINVGSDSGSVSTYSGVFSRHCAMQCSQRPANRQPGFGSIGLDTSPRMSWKPFLRLSKSGSGIAAKRAFV